MKIKKEHYEELRGLIVKAIQDHPGSYTLYRQQGLSNKRYNWDLYWFVKPRLSFNHTDYMNDDHLETALKKITGKK